MSPRKLAYQICCDWQGSSSLLDDLLHAALESSDLEAKDKGLVHELVYGVMRWRGFLDACIKTQVKQPLKNMPKRMLWLIRLGLYQLYFLDRIPDHAALNETVSLVKQHKWKNLVNAVLRSCQKSLDQFSTDDLTTTVPAWILKEYQLSLSKEQLQQVLTYNQSQPFIFARCHESKVSMSGLQSEWDDEGVAYQSVDDSCCVLENTSNMKDWPSFQKGLFVVQDRYASTVVNRMDIQADHRVLDVCAAPGGKSMQIASLLNDAHQLTALDSSEFRLERVRENAQRLGLSGIDIVCADAAIWETKDRFDCILVDAPCSNLGVLARRVDARWRLRMEDQLELFKIQRAILANVQRFLGENALLCYSTCTISVKENEEQVSWLLKTYPQLSLIESSLTLPEEGVSDGGYCALFRRTNDI